jgi:hypothetical protein
MMTDEIKYDRRQFIGAAVMTIAATQLDVLLHQEQPGGRTLRQSTPKQTHRLGL